MPTVHSFTVLPALPDSLKDLETIAKNIYWSWNPEFVEHLMLSAIIKYNWYNLLFFCFSDTPLS